MTITYFHQTNTDLFLEGHVAHSYYIFLMIGLYHLNERLSTDVVFDFSKAFDRLLLKFEAYGITGKLLVWFRNLLMGRHKCVKVVILGTD